MSSTSPRLLLVAVGTALQASVIPYTLEFAALRRLPQQTFGVLLSLEPAVTVVVPASIGSTVSAGRRPVTVS